MDVIFEIVVELFRLPFTVKVLLLLRSRMLKRAIFICILLEPGTFAVAYGQSNSQGVPVEVVATAFEYVPRSTTVVHSGHSYTNCSGNTSYFARFNGYGNSGFVSGSADTSTNCKTTLSPPTETTVNTYLRVNYTIVEGERALYLLSCTQRWKPTRRERMVAGLAAGVAGSTGASNDASGKIEQNAAGTWSECPAFAIGGKYALTVRNTSDARLEGAARSKPFKLDYLSSAALSVAKTDSGQSPQAQAVGTLERAKVHVTSSPSGGEIYVDGKFFGNAPSDITLAAGEHVVKVTIAGREWSRSIEISAGEITVHADLADK